jgi:Trypsin-like peptidase domain
MAGHSPIVSRLHFWASGLCVFGLCVFGLCVFGGACGSTAARTYPLEPVEVLAAGCTLVGLRGSGAVVDPHLIVTAAHVVAGSESIDLIDSTGAHHAAVIVAIDTQRDVAVLRSSTLVGHHHELRSLVASETGTFVGYGDSDPTPTPFAVSKPAVISSEDIYSKGDYARDGYVIDAVVDAGDSGAALVVGNDIGGIVWSRSRDSDTQAFAIDALVVDDVLKNAGRLAVPGVPCV